MTLLTCARPECRRQKLVKDRTQRYCSKRCAILMNPQMRNKSANSRGGRMRAHRARMALLVRIQGKTPLEAFRMGYVRGLQASHRQITKKLIERYERRTWFPKVQQAG